MTLTVVYDNRALGPGLEPDWGFSCLIETPDTTILFDTGQDGTILLRNMATLGHPADKIQTVVLSHNHADHTGGAAALLRQNNRLQVYALPSTAPEVRAGALSGARWCDVGEPQQIADGIWTTGPLGTALPEQSLILQGEAGQVLITGCAHPGIVEIVSRVREHGSVSTVIGGLHLKDMTAAECRAVVSGLQALGVLRVAPCHCTGDRAIEQFREAYGKGFTAAGVGARFGIGSPPPRWHAVSSADHWD
jgi:7,8-dihydropterin-6-yl-methyl-4-(beta-D-ribofuranosyl)aminobenzene 5'-phosphate synthase